MSAVGAAINTLACRPSSAGVASLTQLECICCLRYDSCSSDNQLCVTLYHMQAPGWLACITSPQLTVSVVKPNTSCVSDSQVYLDLYII